jgi:hypothetical protein
MSRAVPTLCENTLVKDDQVTQDVACSSATDLKKDILDSSQVAGTNYHDSNYEFPSASNQGDVTNDCDTNYETADTDVHYRCYQNMSSQNDLDIAKKVADLPRSGHDLLQSNDLGNGNQNAPISAYSISDDDDDDDDEGNIMGVKSYDLDVFRDKILQKEQSECDNKNSETQKSDCDYENRDTPQISDCGYENRDTPQRSDGYENRDTPQRSDCDYERDTPAVDVSKRDSLHKKKKKRRKKHKVDKTEEAKSNSDGADYQSTDCAVVTVANDQNESGLQVNSCRYENHGYQSDSDVYPSSNEHDVYNAMPSHMLPALNHSCTVTNSISNPFDSYKTLPNIGGVRDCNGNDDVEGRGTMETDVEKTGENKKDKLMDEDGDEHVPEGVVWTSEAYDAVEKRLKEKPSFFCKTLASRPIASFCK